MYESHNHVEDHVTDNVVDLELNPKNHIKDKPKCLTGRIPKKISLITDESKTNFELDHPLFSNKIPKILQRPDKIKINSYTQSINDSNTDMLLSSNKKDQNDVKNNIINRGEYIFKPILDNSGDDSGGNSLNHEETSLKSPTSSTISCSTDDNNNIINNQVNSSNYKFVQKAVHLNNNNTNISEVNNNDNILSLPIDKTKSEKNIMPAVSYSHLPGKSTSCVTNTTNFNDNQHKSNNVKSDKLLLNNKLLENKRNKKLFLNIMSKQVPITPLIGNKIRGNFNHIDIPKHNSSLHLNYRHIDHLSKTSLETNNNILIDNENYKHKSAIKYFVARSKKGKIRMSSSINQDRYIIHFHSRTNSILLMVLDGHGDDGHIISEYAKLNFPSILFDHPLFFDDPLESLNLSIRHLHHVLTKVYPKECELSGTTLVCCVVRDGLLYIANVGDSRLFLIKMKDEKLVTSQITEEHKFSKSIERSRINKKRAELIKSDVEGKTVYRLYAKKKGVPGLAMSRSIADTIAHKLGVVYSPHLSKYQLKGNERYIVLCTDGIYEYVNNKDIADFIRMNNYNIDDATEDIITQSVERCMKTSNYCDDSTIIIAAIDTFFSNSLINDKSQ